MKDHYFPRKKFITNYIVAIITFILTLIMGIVIFFNGVSIAVENNSRKTLITNVVRQSEHLNTILNINYSYLNVLAQELSKSQDLFSEDNVSLIQAFMHNTDLRLNPKAGRPASEILKELSKEELENILVENSDEPYADILAKNIYSFIRSGMEVETTRQLYKIIDKTLNFIEDKNRKDIVNKTAARVFQALRIEVNQEFEVLYEFVEKLPHILKPGGRVAILTFHSGEDRIVKKTFKEMKNSGVYEDVCRNVIRPTKEECHRNSRAKSTKMRWAIKAK